MQLAKSSSIPCESGTNDHGTEAHPCFLEPDISSPLFLIQRRKRERKKRCVETLEWDCQVVRMHSFQGLFSAHTHRYIFLGEWRPPGTFINKMG